MFATARCAGAGVAKLIPAPGSLLGAAAPSAICRRRSKVRDYDVLPLVTQYHTPEDHFSGLGEVASPAIRSMSLPTPVVSAWLRLKLADGSDKVHSTTHDA
ncbi:hypothetical protein NDU88_006479 [Pleurodeles waltl]|uniref:Uncharacterized protein n=1 Tax=Pleurodeles waltl TaxID=8319 RepID=A0AAV7QM28_PLEWA|nr:hypothetical protein NDU88_006479 [Pleurodeles waltl]